MKNILLFAILALSFNAKAQDLHPKSNIQYSTSGSIAYVLKKLNVIEEKSTNHFPEKNFGGTIKHQTTMLLPPVQIIDSIIAWQWDPDTLIMGWRFFFKEIDIVYDVENIVTSVTLQFWNVTTWQTFAKFEYTHDANNNQTSVLYQGWTGGAWENVELETYAYDLNNNQTSYLDQDWNVNAWENYVQSFYTYDANNNETKEIDQSWSGSSWENTIQYIYTYNIQNKQTREVDQAWNSFAWENYKQYIYAYDADNNRTGEVNQEWHGSNWENISNSIYTYDANHNQTGSTYQIWDGSTWVNYSRYTYTYDDNNDRINGLYQKWNGGAWEYSGQVIYTYTYADGFLESSSNRSIDVAGNVFESDSTHYYFHTVTSIKDLAADDGTFNLYPNPTSGKFTISSNSTLNGIEIYNLLGERIYADHSNQQTPSEIDLSAQGKGIYFIKMYDGTKMYNRKIVVQ